MGHALNDQGGIPLPEGDRVLNVDLPAASPLPAHLTRSYHGVEVTVRQRAFLDHVDRVTEPVMVRPGVRCWRMRGAVEVLAYRTADTIYLGLVLALVKGQGDGAATLRWITALADCYGVALTGWVERQGKEGLKDRDLRKWYARHGFEVNKSGWMTRAPQPMTQEQRRAVASEEL